MKKQTTKSTSKTSAKPAAKKTVKPVAKKTTTKKPEAKKPVAKKPEPKVEPKPEPTKPATKVAKTKPEPKVVDPKNETTAIALKAGRLTNEAWEKALETGELAGGRGEFAVPLLRKSLIKTPVQLTWEYLDSMRAACEKRGEKIRRRDAIVMLVEHGIAYYTARTQYQSWKTANKF